MKYIIILFAVLFSVTGATAQEYRSDVSIRSQIFGGTVPGAQYRSDVKSHKPQSAMDKRESVGAMIKSNTEPGKQYKKSNSGSSGRSEEPSAAKVASDKNAEKIQPAAAPALPQNLTQ